MLMEFLAAIVSGFAAAGLALIARRFGGERVPRFVVPVAAGLGMIGFTIWSEYTWFERSTASLPEGVVVIEAVGQRSAFRPWTFVWPLVTEFTAVDAAAARANPALPDHVMVRTYELVRHAPVVRRLQIVDCRDQRRAILTGAESFTEDGRPEDADWQPMATDDRLFRAVCRGRIPVAEG